MPAQAALPPLGMRYFVSYAHADNKRKQDLLARLQVRLAIAKNYRFTAWEDRRLLAGEDWLAGIMAAISECDFGLLLLSPAFFASSFIGKEELPPLLAEKRLVPVALKPFPLDGSAELAGIERLQIFPYPYGKAYSECRGDAAKDAFAAALFSEIIKITERDLAPHR